VLTSLPSFVRSSEELVPRHTPRCLHCQFEGTLIGRRGQLACYYKVVQLIALGVEVFFHPRDIGIGYVLLTQELGRYGQHTSSSTESYRVIHIRQKTALISVSCHVLSVRGSQLPILTTQTTEDENSQVKLPKQPLFFCWIMRCYSKKVRSNPSSRSREYKRTIPVEYRDDDCSDSVLLHKCEDTHDAMQDATLRHRLLEVHCED
jgi:hypothetical protein